MLLDPLVPVNDLPSDKTALACDQASSFQGDKAAVGDACCQVHEMIIR